MHAGGDVGVMLFTRVHTGVPYFNIFLKWNGKSNIFINFAK